MGVFLRFSNAELGLALIGHIFAETVGQLLRGVGAGCFDIRRVLGQRHEIRQFGVLLALETVEILLHEGAGHFPGAVGPEIHEQNRVAVVNGAFRLPRCVNTSGHHEFVILAALVGLLKA